VSAFVAAGHLNSISPPRQMINCFYHDKTPPNSVMCLVYRFRERSYITLRPKVARLSGCKRVACGRCQTRKYSNVIVRGSELLCHVITATGYVQT
jgi:hypothetical protein